MELRCIVVICLALIINSCGGGSDSEPSMDTSLIPTWSFNDYQYVGGASSGGISTSFNGIELGTLVITTEEDESNGDFSGSALTFSFPARGLGTYRIVSSDEFGEFLTPESAERVLLLSCAVGLATLTATRYEGSRGGIFNVSIDDEGRYKFDSQSSGVSLGNPLDLRGGVPNRPDTGALMIQDAFNFSRN